MSEKEPPQLPQERTAEELNALYAEYERRLYLLSEWVCVQKLAGKELLMMLCNALVNKDAEVLMTMEKLGDAFNTLHAYELAHPDDKISVRTLHKPNM